jgi:hypothetical protein
MGNLKPGDLVCRVKLGSRDKRVGKPRLLGILLEEPKFPQWGNYPKSYTVLTPAGIQIIRDRPRALIEAVP